MQEGAKLSSGAMCATFQVFGWFCFGILAIPEF
jgi:hypothetical protein